MIRPDPSSPLQEMQQAFYDVLVDARDGLDPATFRVFVDFVCDAIAHEAGRCVRWERRQDEAA